MQTRLSSLLEAFANVAIGFGIMLVAQLVIFPAHGIYIGIGTNLSIGLSFTVVSVARSYTLRRLFNWLTQRKHKKGI